MRLFMLRSSLFCLVVISVGSIMPEAWAEDPPCPSQIAPPAAAPAHNPRGTGNIDISADAADVGVDGKGSLKGNVVVRQGEVELHANEMQIDKPNQFVKSSGSIEYSDPLVHVTGAGGSYSGASGAEFDAAQFELRQRAARGAADRM
jgi:LPS-assembly protein